MAGFGSPYRVATPLLILGCVGLLAAACGSSIPARATVHHNSSTTTSTADTGTTSATHSTVSSTTPATPSTTPATRSSARTSVPSSSATTRPSAAVSITGPKTSTPAPVAPATTPPALATTTAPSTGTVVSSLNTASYGDIVTDGAGRTLYLYTPDDSKSSPQCTSAGGCAATWPPLNTSGIPKAEGGVQQGLLGSEDGQVTYNGHPLYDYSGDSGPGQTNGEGAGGIWYVVSTSGNPVL